MPNNDFTKDEMYSDSPSLTTHEPAMSTPPKCAAVGYIRVSTGKQDCSMEVQEERIVQYCQANGLELVEILREPAVSAAKVKLDKRPVGSQLATNTFLSHTPARHIVALKLDRLFRNAVDALTHVEKWEKAGIHFHLVDFGGQAVNSSTPMGMMMLTMLAGFAALERDLIAERTTAAFATKRPMGRSATTLPLAMMPWMGSWFQTSPNSG